MVLRALLIDALGTLIELEPPAPALRALLASASACSSARSRRVTRWPPRSPTTASTWARVATSRRCNGCARSAPRCSTALPPSAALDRFGPRALTATLIDSLRFRAYDDAREALLAARAAGLRIVVASNWDASLPAVLAHRRAGELLDGVVTSAVVGAPKPAEKVFGAALALAGAAPQEALHVGDDLAQDVDGARGAGIAAVLLKRDGTAGPDGVITISSLRGLRQVLRAGALISQGR